MRSTATEWLSRIGALNLRRPLKPLALALTLLGQACMVPSEAGERRKAPTPSADGSEVESVEGSRRLLRAFERQTYKLVGGRELSVYVLKPTPGASTQPAAAAVFFHGGAWISGGPQAFARQAQYLTERGMVTVLVEYRLLSRETKEPPTAPIQDAKSAVRWVRAHAAKLGVDPARIVAVGGSAGGHLAAFTGMVDGMDDPSDDKAISARPNALVLFNPVFDNGPTGWAHARVGDRYREYSPYHNISADDPPSIVFTGDQDHLVDFEMVCDFERQMRARGAKATVRIFAGAGHAFFNYSGGSNPAYYETLLEADRFLVSLGWLQGPPTLQMPARLQRSSAIRGCTANP